MHNRIPLSRGLGSSAAATVGGVVLGRCARVRGGRAAVAAAPPAPDRDDDRVAPGQRRGGAARRVRRVGAARRPGRGDPVRRAGRAPVRAVHPGPPPRDGGDAPRPARRGPAAPRRGEPGPGRDRRRGDRRRAGSSSSRTSPIDRLHEPYRSVPYPELPRLTLAAREAGALGAFLSGAGSTICAFVAPGDDPSRRSRRRSVPRRTRAASPGRTAIVAPRNRGPEIRAA